MTDDNVAVHVCVGEPASEVLDELEALGMTVRVMRGADLAARPSIAWLQRFVLRPLIAVEIRWRWHTWDDGDPQGQEAALWRAQQQQRHAFDDPRLIDWAEVRRTLATRSDDATALCNTLRGHTPALQVARSQLVDWIPLGTIEEQVAFAYACVALGNYQALAVVRACAAAPQLAVAVRMLESLREANDWGDDR